MVMMVVVVVAGRASEGARSTLAWKELEGPTRNLGVPLTKLGGPTRDQRGPPIELGGL